MKIDTAVKTRQAVIGNAKYMYDFCIKNHDENTHIFKLIVKSDLKAIMDDYEGVTVQTLSGKCTRSLHQIKHSISSGLLQRSFSCFCSFCESGDYDNCINKAYTSNSNFKKCHLPTNGINDSNDNDEEVGEYYDDVEYDFAES